VQRLGNCTHKTDRLPHVKRQLFCAFQSTPHESQLNHETTHADNAFKSVGHSCGTLRTAVTCANQMRSNNVVAPACLSVCLPERHDKSTDQQVTGCSRVQIFFLAMIKLSVKGYNRVDTTHKPATWGNIKENKVLILN